MAKGNMLLGHARGSIGTITYNRVKGQQVSKAKVSANPSKTFDQTLRRVMIKGPTQFSRMAKDNFFRFTFKSKKMKQSDYNVFTKNNVNKTPMYLPKDFSTSPTVYAGPFMISEGTLPTLYDNNGGEVTIHGGATVSSIEFFHNLIGIGENEITWGVFCQRWIEKGLVKNGDALTFMYLVTNHYYNPDGDVFYNDTPGSWLTRKIVVDVSCSIPCDDYLASCDIVRDGPSFGMNWADLIDTTTWDADTVGVIAACIINRRVKGRIVCSTSRLALNYVAWDAYNRLSSEEYKQIAVESYEATENTQSEDVGNKVVPSITRIIMKWNHSTTSTVDWTYDTIYPGYFWNKKYLTTVNSQMTLYGKNLSNYYVLIRYYESDDYDDPQVYAGYFVGFFGSARISSSSIALNVEGTSRAKNTKWIEYISFRTEEAEGTGGERPELLRITFGRP